MTGAWQLHPVVVTALRAAGWSGEYSVPIDTWVQQLDSEGYTVFDYGRAVLSAFGGLRIEPIEDIQPAFSSGPLRVGLVPDEYDRVAEWSVQLDVPLLPIGEWMNYYFVVIAPDMRVFAGALGQLLYLGPTFEKALELIVTANRAAEVLAPE